MWNTVVRHHLYHFGVDHDHPEIVWGTLIEHRGDEAVQTDAFPRAGRQGCGILICHHQSRIRRVQASVSASTFLPVGALQPSLMETARYCCLEPDAHHLFTGTGRHTPSAAARRSADRCPTPDTRDLTPTAGSTPNWVTAGLD